MEHELWNLKVKDYNITAYTTHFNELILLCPEMVPMEKKKVEAYIRGLSDNIQGEVTSSSRTTLSRTIRMDHKLMEQKRKFKMDREAEAKKRKWESFQPEGKARNTIRKGCQLFLAQVTGKEPTKRHLEDESVIRDFPKVFPDDMPGLPPHRQVEFKINLVPGATPVARAPYRLAPSEIKELSKQLQELLEKGFIRPSSSP
ncbi:hypothetical protein Tco_0842439 [Tanacetum coccineum]|uniref:Ty3 transposon capsid-like protein domain-containing protein n=1 Tax=Tanacetum coccineum TaxID=301880 RepID=A0ABQ5B2S0_9ASTR